MGLELNQFKANFQPISKPQLGGGQAVGGQSNPQASVNLLRGTDNSLDVPGNLALPKPAEGLGTRLLFSA